MRSGAAAEAALPEIVAKDDDVVTAGLVLARRKVRPCSGGDVEDLEEIVGAGDKAHGRGGAGWWLQVGGACVVAGERLEGAIEASPVAVLGPGGGLVVTALGEGDGDDDAVGVRVGERAQNGGVEDRKDCGGDADCERDGEHGRGRKGGCAAQLAKRVAEVMDEVLEWQRHRRSLLYSARSAVLGSTEAARRAGRRAAMVAASSMARAARQAELPKLSTSGARSWVSVRVRSASSKVSGPAEAGTDERGRVRGQGR